MFEFFFKYPAPVFGKGHFVLLGSWPKWVLFGAMLAVAAALGAVMWRKSRALQKQVWTIRALVLWALQSALLVLLLLLLWEPAISVTSLKPQENIVAVVVDDSRSMSLRDGGSRTRGQQASNLLENGLINDLRKHFQVRLYRLGAGVERIGTTRELATAQPATQIGKGLRQIADQAATLPVGAVVLLSDGSDNSGGVDASTISELRRRRLPVSTIGFGRTRLVNDVEMDGFDIPDKVLAGSRLQGQVTIRQAGFGARRTRLVITGGGRVLASQEVVLTDMPEQTVNIEFTLVGQGVQTVAAELDPLPGEENIRNNRLSRVLSIDAAKRRILYVEGEPRWDFKFMRRALDDDPVVQIVSMLRTTQNKMYRQGIANPHELEDGFPSKAEDLFDFQAIVLGSIEAAFFTPAQQEAIKDFVDRRGGGLLFLGGRWALADGGYSIEPFAELLPVKLPQRKNTFQRTMVPAELTDAGKKSLICRIEDDATKSNDHWEVLPYLANYQDAGSPKPGAVILARMDVSGNRLPLLVSQNYGRGRTAVLATGGVWRWRMQQPVGDNSEETFWRQLLRWEAGATPSRVVASTPEPNLNDDGKTEIRAEVRDTNYYPVSNADVHANIVNPDGSSTQIALRPEPLQQGIYSVEWDATQTGAYGAEIVAAQGSKELGRDILTFQRQNGAAENFHAERNEELLKKLAEDTGGSFYTPETASRLSDQIAYSEAGITTRELKDLWDMPIVFLAILALRSTEWLLRRRWGAV